MPMKYDGINKIYKLSIKNQEKENNALLREYQKQQKITMQKQKEIEDKELKNHAKQLKLDLKNKEIQDKLDAKNTKVQESLEAKKQSSLIYTRKKISEYNKKDFVLYFKTKYEEANNLAYYEVNIPAACGVLGVVLNNFYKAGYDNELVLRFIDYSLKKGKAEGVNVKLRTLHYGISDYLFKVKQFETEFGSLKDKIRQLPEYIQLKGKLEGIDSSSEDILWNFIRNIWNKENK